MTDPARRVSVLASTAAACVAVLGACGASHASQPELSDPSRASEAAQALDVTVTTDKPVYDAGASVRGRITVVNRTDAAVRLGFSDAQRFDFLVRNAGGEAVWQWGVFHMFAQVVGQEVVAAGDSLRYEAILDVDLAPGSYSLVGSLVARDHPLQATATFTVR